MIDDLRLVWQVSVRRACAVLGAGRSTYQHQSRRPPQAVLKKRILEIAQTRVRYGYRRIHVLLKREGWQVNVKRVYRLYAEESLQLRNKTPKRKVSAKFREERCVASEPNEVWAMDFMSDQLFDGRRIRILTIVDAFSRLSPVINVRQSYRGSDVVETLERVTRVHGKPRDIADVCSFTVRRKRDDNWQLGSHDRCISCGAYISVADKSRNPLCSEKRIGVQACSED